MKKLMILLTFLPNFAFAANFYWFEKVDSEIKKTSGITETSYRPGVRDTNFSFTKDGKRISVWVNFGIGQNAVYGFSSLNGVNSVVTVKNNKFEVAEGNMFDQMQTLHRRGNLTAGDLNRSVTVSNEGQLVELQSPIVEGLFKISVLKLKQLENGLEDIHLSFTIRGTGDANEALSILKIVRPIVETQIEF